MQLQKPGYVCVTDVGNLINAHRNSPELKDSINNSLISLPDGRPLSVFAKLKNIKSIERVAGPDFMEEIFKKTSGTGISHFFLGDTEEVLSKLIKRILTEFDLQIAGSYSPVFGIWDKNTNDLIIEKINSANPDVIWISLGGGKQEIWMKNNYFKLKKGLMTGVGAAFRFYTGDIKRAPLFFQKAGLEWFFRLIQQPGKMFFRYSGTLPYFIIYAIQDLFKNNQKPNKNNNT
ncbi:MAG TPA: WecB/TagA/CpsF family glycosyltransferase [Ignavibacteria bacterium]|nr:WecB/TagA/CpsF family glycosyltransferase [Ignavibacteria bacterium]